MDDLALLIYKRVNVLERIDVSNNKITYAGANFVFRALLNDHVVKRISMGMNELNGGVIEDLELCIRKNKYLEYLGFFECKLSDSVAVTIGNALTDNKRLKVLVLGSNFISDNGALAIGKALIANTALNDLDLSGNQITDRGLEGVVEGILKNRTLEGLNLSENKLGDIGGQRLLHSIVQNPHIKRLKIAMNCISKRYITEMETAIKKNIIRAENQTRSMIMSQFTNLKNALIKSDEVKKETENVKKQKNNLKKQILEDIQVLNNAHENKEKHLDLLKEEMEELFAYEKKLDKDIMKVEEDIKVVLRGMYRRLGRRKRGR